MPRIIGSYDRLTQLESTIRESGPVVVMFSGGADSSFLLWVCARVLKRSDVAAVTFGAETTSSLDLQSAQAVAAWLNVKHIIYPGPEMQSQAYLANDLLRCYYCKRERFSFLQSQPEIIPGARLIEGSVVDDLQENRPGTMAIREAGIHSPLLDAGISKADIARIAADLHLPFMHRKSDSCLATRIATGQRLDHELLRRLRMAENAIHDLGFEMVRVRWQNGEVRVELEPEKLTAASALWQEIVVQLNCCGFEKIAVEPSGYYKSRK